MAIIEAESVARSRGEAAMPETSWWLWLSAPIVVLALFSSLVGVFGRGTYARETANWSGQAVGQDIANLAAYVLLGVLAVATARGSMRAYVAWIGLVAFSVYSFAIYAFAVHFGRMFLVYVAVFGLSVYALTGALNALDRVRWRAMFGSGAPVRSTAIVLIVISGMFYLLWLSEVIPTIASGKVPDAVRDAGLLTNPVHVLDMAVLLPAGILAGILLLRRNNWGFALAPAVLTCFVFLGVGIVAAILVLRSRGEEAPMAVAIGVSVLTLVESAVLVRFLGSAHQ